MIQHKPRPDLVKQIKVVSEELKIVYYICSRHTGDLMFFIESLQVAVDSVVAGSITGASVAGASGA